VAGTHGMAIYASRSRRWRLFGDAQQEKGIRVQVCVCMHACVHACEFNFLPYPPIQSLQGRPSSPPPPI
jgi:hypothetical protein